MNSLQEMKKLLNIGKKLDYQKKEFPILMQITIDDLLDLWDLVDLIRRFFTESEKVNFLLKEAMSERMKIIGWKFGTMFLWNFIEMKSELFQNLKSRM